ncbi:MAG: filamentous hemagglutinin N-terminal domain-containing protein, partial [Gammaproteobacteria bacterium]|nr:filamentous hemagglutinin N-terminal domain-containing protein [Gammaproteobacteria bacterium]
SAYGEIVTDGSLAPASTLTGPDYQIDANIGQLQGSNLFHSFSSFNIDSAESATFSGPAHVSNIFSRVTGGSTSTINGELGSDIAGANLFFMNPNGILFGEQASLNLSGSFHATTADYIAFQDESHFSASNTGNVNLTSSPVAAFGFLDSNIGNISVNQSSLQVTDGKTIALIGGNIDIQGIGNHENFAKPEYVNLMAPNGAINLIATASAGEINIQNMTTSQNAFPNWSDITLSDAAAISVRGNPGGKILIRGGNLVLENSIIDAANSGELDHQGNAVDIHLHGSFELEQSVPELDVDTGIQASSYSSGGAGDIQINTDSLRLTGISDNRAFISTRSFDSGDSGNINIITNDLNLDSGLILIEGLSSGESGDIAISADSIVIDGSRASSYILSSGYGQGNSGNITIDANSLNATSGDFGFSGITTQISSGASGSGSSGNISLNISQLALSYGAQISTSRFIGSGASGDININADSILLTGIDDSGYATGLFSGISDPNFAGTFGKGGHINITTDQLQVEQFAVISTLANYPAQADSGDINIDADSIRIDSTGLITSSGYGFGRSGVIDIHTRILEIEGSSQLHPSFNFIQSGIFSSAGAAASAANDILISASQSVSITNGGT